MARSLPQEIEDRMRFLLRGITGTSKDTRDRSIAFSVLALALAHKIMREVPEKGGKGSGTAEDNC